MALSRFWGLFLVHIALLSSLCFAEDPFVTYDFDVSYITASPLGVPQQATGCLLIGYIDQIETVLHGADDCLDTISPFTLVHCFTIFSTV
ncbi:hypothetical protein V6N13_060401 [Hibiscus sabdariffa]